VSESPQKNRRSITRLRGKDQEMIDLGEPLSHGTSVAKA
jgi:hypothetical protein